MSAIASATSDFVTWGNIDFTQIEYRVKKLQMRIEKAYRDNDIRKVSYLQNKLIHSFYAKALAVKTVTSNKGNHTPGIDGVTWTKPEDKLQAVFELNRRGYNPKPLRRIYIPKTDDKLRPLSIPTMKDRAMQTLYKFALDPIAEATADSCSYGFRPNRGVQDAISKYLEILSKEPDMKWVLKADIKSCFDSIDHDWLLKNIPMDKAILRKFLKCGYVENSILYPTERGVPQGGSISSVMCNMTLDGLELTLKEHFGDLVRIIRYADDFIILGYSSSFLAATVKSPGVENFLSERGLELSEEKTRIINIDDGFTFLGWDIRREDSLIITKPTEKAVESLLNKIENALLKYDLCFDNGLQEALKFIIEGWLCNYYGLSMTQALREVKDKAISRVINCTGDYLSRVYVEEIFARFDI